ncbi:hypothetical protein [Streptomyces sp. MMBL 11-1]|uniref:hypothetical protein n=1 Tax=Streptomyces sp. MMBL 11-1 TaxID=3026420 RepID=UPI002361C26D|nr:hypothetical protein [Streptomyces sp. MMBL 11-1]
MPTPTFTFHPTTPPDEKPTNFQVYADKVPDVDDAYLGIVYLTAGGEWVADWHKRNGAPSIAMPGFGSKQSAAEALWWYAPPSQSVRSRPIGQTTPVSDERTIDLSACGCCITNGCDCEGLNRNSQRFKTEQTYQIHPSLIPAPGVLISLMPMDNGDFLVDLNTRGMGTGIGYLQRQENGRYDVLMGQKSLGTVEAPEVGMWAVLQAHTTTRSYSRLVESLVDSKETK